MARTKSRFLASGCFLAGLSLLAGRDYRWAVEQQIANGVRDRVLEAILFGCATGGDPVELLVGALVNGAVFGRR